MKVILGSKSPRRQELMGLLGVPFDVMVSDCKEVIKEEKPSDVTKDLALQKAMAVAEKIADGKVDVESCVVIGSDTVVAIDDKILGKPKDKEDARAMMRMMSGRSHMVYTGVALVQVSVEKTMTCLASFAEGTKVHIMPMSEKEIENYIATKEPYDKAGGYGIQGNFARYVSGIEGDYNTVIGLPVHRLYKELVKIGIL